MLTSGQPQPLKVQEDGPGDVTRAIPTRQPNHSRIRPTSLGFLPGSRPSVAGQAQPRSFREDAQAEKANDQGKRGAGSAVGLHRSSRARPPTNSVRRSFINTALTNRMTDPKTNPHQPPQPSRHAPPPAPSPSRVTFHSPPLHPSSQIR